MRVALFSEVYWPMVSGVSLTMQRAVEGLRERGHAVRVYSASYELPPGDADRPEVHRSRSRPLFISPEVQWAFPRRDGIRADLTRFQPDLVHLATEFPIGLAGLRSARELGLPIVASSHTDYERYAALYGLNWAVKPGWRYLRWFYGHASRVLCPSVAYQTHLHARGIRHTAIWSRGVDAERFHPRHRSEAWRWSLGVGPDDLLVTCVGRIAPEKGIDVLLDAWGLLGDLHDRARLVFVGSGLMEAEIARRGLPGVRVAGFRRDRELSAGYASADLFVLPSATETFGNVLLEAMASGLPCIAAAAGGPMDFVDHGWNGWLVHPNDPPALADALRTLLADGAQRRRLARAARATAEGRSWSAVHDGLVAEYERAIRAGHAAAA
jgi:glycosyltransferase involved in cell wall biosynthesis